MLKNLVHPYIQSTTVLCDKPHNKLQRKILLDISVWKQCSTLHVNNSILN